MQKKPTVVCHNLTALMPCFTTSLLLIPHYTRPHRNSDNLHNAVSIGDSLVVSQVVYLQTAQIWANAGVVLLSRISESTTGYTLWDLLLPRPDRRDHRLLVSSERDTGKCGVNEMAVTNGGRTSYCGLTPNMHQWIIEIGNKHPFL